MKAAWSRGKRGGGHDVSLAPFGNIPEQHVTSAAVLAAVMCRGRCDYRRLHDRYPIYDW